jgi:hypothetical protein
MKVPRMHAAVPLCATLLAVLAGQTSPALAQDAAKITVKFKIFDTNEPIKRLNPLKTASNFVRDPGTKKAEFLETVEITRPEKEGLDELKVSKGWLIEQLLIQIDDPEKEYNPAIITKIVSAADMTVYPGASKATDPFAFQAYQAQMGAYRTLLSQLLEEVDPSIRERVRDDLRAAFGKQLRNMGEVDKRLANAKPDELEAARKLRNEVFKLYGLPPVEPDEADNVKLPAVIECQPCKPCQPYQPCRSCWPFRRR